MDALLFAKILKGLAEITLMFFLGRAVLVMFFMAAPHKLEGNFVYQLFVKGTAPVIKFLRLISPKFVLDRHLVFAAFFLTLVIWFGSVLWKAQICAAQPNNPSCAEFLQQRPAGGAVGGQRP
jgi:hypothetical protein